METLFKEVREFSASLWGYRRRAVTLLLLKLASMLSPKAYQRWKKGDLIVQILSILTTLIVEYTGGLDFIGSILTAEFVIGIVQILSTLLWLILGKGYEVLPFRRAYYFSLLGWLLLCVVAASFSFSYILLPIAGCMAFGYLILTAIESSVTPTPLQKHK